MGYLIWIVNVVISWANARSAGKVWVEAKHIGGWQRFMVWMAAVMSACGFTWCYLLLLVLGSQFTHPPLLSPDAAQAALSLGYLIVIPGFLFAGAMIWVDSLVNAWRQRDLRSMATAAWNTYAQVHNSYQAMRGVPEAVEEVSKVFFGGKDSDRSGKGSGALVLLFVAALACLSGVLTTWGIINHYAGTAPLPERAAAAA